jgi:SHS2 domain-containing protein
VDEGFQPGWSGGRFKALETTADVGVVAEGPSMPAAFASAAAGLYWVVTPAQARDEGERASVSGVGDDLGLALARALQRLVVEFDTRQFVGASCLASLFSGRRAEVRLELRGERFDPARHPQGVEVKAVTHHGLKVDRALNRVEVLFDI